MNKQQLANRIWASANKMRAKIDANDYKDYILGLVFYKFLSDYEVNYLKREAQWTDEDLTALVEDYNDPDAVEQIEFCRRNIGYFISYDNLFSTWLKPNADFSVSTLNEAIRDFDRLIGDAFKDVYKDIFNALQAGLSKLGNDAKTQTKAIKEIIRLIKDIPTDGSQDYDVLGYVYEYLISNFAASAGKKAGEFYTPHEVATLMSEIVAEHHKDKQSIDIYDPTSGSGSLLITIGKSLGKHLSNMHSIKYFAQEIQPATYNLTRMNLVMRGIRPYNIVTKCADSLDEDWPMEHVSPKPLRVDAVVSNPPYSLKWDNGNAEYDARFKSYGVAPKSKADYAFLLHELHHLKDGGIMTIVLPHGVLFRGEPDEKEGEGKIRKNLIETNNIDAIIGLPANIFFGTGIPTLVMVLKQHRDRDDVLIIDASKGYVKDGKNNRLRACDIKRIADTVRDRVTVPGFSRVVSRQEIRDNGYNLNIPRYVDSSEQAEKFDIYATMYGGIPNSEIDELAPYWQVLPSLKDQLFTSESDKPYSSLATEDVSQTIADNTDVKVFRNHFSNALAGLEESLDHTLITDVECLSLPGTDDFYGNNILERLADMPLIDRYAAYQAFAERWQPIADDIETIQQEGKDAIRVVEQAYKVVKKNDEDVEVPDGLKGRIIPFDLIQHEKFQDELDAIARKEAELESISDELTEIQESFTEDEVAAYMTDDDTPKLDTKAVKADAKDKNGEVEPETLAKLKKMVKLWDRQSAMKKGIKADKAELEKLTIQSIINLDDDDIERLLHLKWIEPIMQGIHATLYTTFSTLEKSVSHLASKYQTSMASLDSALADNNATLQSLISQLTGDTFAIRGLEGLINE